LEGTEPRHHGFMMGIGDEWFCMFDFLFFNFSCLYPKHFWMEFGGSWESILFRVGTHGQMDSAKGKREGKHRY
jgi:hypothetical protein